MNQTAKLSFVSLAMDTGGSKPSKPEEISFPSQLKTFIIVKFSKGHLLCLYHGGFYKKE